MLYTHLGRTGLKVSRLCLGTMNFGPGADKKTSFKIMDKAIKQFCIDNNINEPLDSDEYVVEQSGA